jgi:hypothetical protein
MNAEEYTRRSVILTAELPVDGEVPGGWELIIETYRLGQTYFTTISSADAGARFARGQGLSRDEAEHGAMQKAVHWLGQTRRFPPN